MSHIISLNPPTRSLSITGHWNVSLPSGVSPWNSIFGPGRGSKYNTTALTNRATRTLVGGGSYSSAEMLSVCSTASADWATRTLVGGGWGLTPLLRCSRCILLLQPAGLSANKELFYVLSFISFDRCSICGSNCSV